MTREINRWNWQEMPIARQYLPGLHKKAEFKCGKRSCGYKQLCRHPGEEHGLKGVVQ